MSYLSPARKRAILLGICGLCLTLSVFGANLAIGADRTALSGDYVSNGLHEEGYYEHMADQLAANMKPEEGQNAGSGEDAPFAEGPPMGDLVDEVVTTEFVRTEMGGAIRDFYAYLHGDRDDLVAVVDMTHVKEGLPAEVGAWVREADLERLHEGVAALAESEAAFRDERAAFEAEQLERIQAETDEHHDEAELRAMWDDQRGDVRAEMVAELEDQVANSDVPPPARPAMVEFGTVRIDGLVREDLTYEAYLANVEDARENLAVGWEQAVAGQLDQEMEDGMDMTEGMNPEARETIDTVRTGVSLTSLLVFLLPLAALSFAGAIGYLSPTRSSALRRIGGVVATVGLLCTVLAVALATVLPDLLAGSEDATAGQTAVAGLVADGFTQFGIQSGLLLGLGLALVVAGVAVRKGYLPIADRPGAPDADDGSTADGPADGETATDGGPAGAVSEGPEDGDATSEEEDLGEGEEGTGVP